MEIELEFNSVIVQPAEMQENYPFIFSAFQPYLPVQKPPKRRRPRKKRRTVASLIDPIIDSINRVSSN